MSPQFEIVFQRLQKIFQDHSKTFSVKAAGAGYYWLHDTAGLASRIRVLTKGR